MDKDTAKNIISAFDKNTYWKFVLQLLKSGYGEDYIKTVPDSYLIKNLYINSPVYYNHFYTFDFFPYRVFLSLKNINISTPSVTKQILQILGNIESSFMLGDIYFINNITIGEKDDYEQYIFPQIEKITKKILHPDQEFGFGNISTFLNNKPETTIAVLNDFFSDPTGISISLNDQGFRINEFISQNTCESGVTLSSKSLLNTVSSHSHKTSILQEFENVLNSNKEHIIEEFISEHFHDVFGTKYDKIETQLWLRFPEFDSNDSNRRLDIFLRNSISNDWELFEIKRELDIITNYRNSPTFKSVVYKSIEQLRNYASILNQEAVKKKLKKEGIEYFYPELHLVIGKKTNDITLKNWRKLISDNSKDVKLITYDTLMSEMKNRLNYLSIYQNK